ncbi:MAG: hypothetical protein ISS48_04585 [Candidatus Aenigmarchaeota archaeon]|nr:hypothetical protein [Candidatus Aenigmarchaeota archaeon]
MIVREIDNKADETENKVYVLIVEVEPGIYKFVTAGGTFAPTYSTVENARGDPYGLRGEGRALLDVTDRIRFGTTLIVPLFGSGVRNRT